MTTYLCPSRPGHQALRNNFASSLLLRTWLPYDWTPRSEAYFVFPLAQGTPGKQCGLAATGVYQPSLRSPWLAAGAVPDRQDCRCPGYLPLEDGAGGGDALFRGGTIFPAPRVGGDRQLVWQ
ncbi:hypothetical protein [Thiolapillus sp.]|uniref:hypothetical protein n=1 Tax=Thiolapillus sp. TaxID=2017437 RepID=UPI003AF4A6A9